MNTVAAVTYVFRDKNWPKKLLVGTLCIFALFVPSGYMLRVIKQVSLDPNSTPPEWDNFGDDFGKGAVVAIAYLFYFFPFLCVGSVIGSALRGDAANLGVVIFVLLIIPVLALEWIAVIRYAITDNVAAFWQFDTNLRVITKHPGLVAFAFTQAAVGSALCVTIGVSLFWTCIGEFAFFTYGNIFVGYTLGELAHRLGLVYQGPGSKIKFAGDFE